jgi:hypothetical protein
MEYDMLRVVENAGYHVRHFLYFATCPPGFPLV